MEVCTANGHLCEAFVALLHAGCTHRDLQQEQRTELMKRQLLRIRVLRNKYHTLIRENCCFNLYPEVLQWFIQFVTGWQEKTWLLLRL